MVAFAVADAAGSADGEWGAMTEYLLSAVDTALSGYALDGAAGGVLLDQAISVRDEGGTELDPDERAGAVLAVILVVALTASRHGCDAASAAATLTNRLTLRWAHGLSTQDAMWFAHAVAEAAAGKSILPDTSPGGVHARSWAPAFAALQALTELNNDRAAQADEAPAEDMRPDAALLRSFSMIAAALARPPATPEQPSARPATLFRRSEISLPTLGSIR